MATREDSLKQVFSRFSGDLRLLGEFIDTLGKAIRKNEPRRLKSTLTKRDRKELNGLVTFLKSAVEQKAKSNQYVVSSPRVGELIMSFVIPFKRQSFLAEMALIYVMAQSEGFLKDLLKAAFLLKPQCLKSKRQLSYEDVLNHGTMDALLGHLAQREAEDLGRGSIDNFDEYYQQKFNIGLSGFPKWHIIREAAFRRNLLVHNSGITNEIYCRAVSHHTRGQHLSTDLKYVTDLLKSLRGFSRYAYTSLRKKVK